MQHKLILQQADLKATNARLAVLRFLEHSEQPLTADEIYDHLRDEHDDPPATPARSAGGRGADKATIYRMLDTFFQKGITNRLEFGEGKYRYELAGDDHHHLICESCGDVQDISDCNITDLEKDIKKKKGFTVKRHALEFYGVCSSCQR